MEKEVRLRRESGMGVGVSKRYFAATPYEPQRKGTTERRRPFWTCGGKVSKGPREESCGEGGSVGEGGFTGTAGLIFDGPSSLRMAVVRWWRE